MLRTTASRSLQLTTKRAFTTSVSRSDKPILPPSSKPSPIDQPTNSTTHFGFKDVPEQLKESLGELSLPSSVLSKLQLTILSFLFRMIDRSQGCILISGVLLRCHERCHVIRNSSIMEGSLRFKTRPSRRTQMFGCSGWNGRYRNEDFGLRERETW